MNLFFVLSINATILAAANYIRDGATIFYVVWIVLSVAALVFAHCFCPRPKIRS